MNTKMINHQDLQDYIENHCRKYYSKYHNKSDILQAGYLALYESIEKGLIQDEIKKKINNSMKRESRFYDENIYSYDFNEVEFEDTKELSSEELYLKHELNEEIETELEKIKDHLTELQQEIFDLLYYNNTHYQLIIEELNISKSTFYREKKVIIDTIEQSETLRYLVDLIN